MKKLLLLSLMLVFSVILSACGSSTETSGSGDSESGEKKTLRVATEATYAPFEYMDGDKVVGFDVDFVKAVAKEAGYEVEIVNVGWDPLFVEVKDGIADLGMSAITINDERKKTYDFSHPYFLSTNKILVPEGSDIKSAQDLKGKTVAVQNATTGQEAVESILGTNHENIKKFENAVLAIMELKGGGADAVVADNTVLEEYAKKNPTDKLEVVTDETGFDAEYYGLMFPKDSKLKAEFDEAINAIFENGTYAKIYEEWFGTTPDVENLKAQQ